MIVVVFAVDGRARRISLHRQGKQRVFCGVTHVKDVLTEGVLEGKRSSAADFMRLNRSETYLLAPVLKTLFSLLFASLSMNQIETD